MYDTNHSRFDWHWPLTRVDIPGFRTIFVRGLLGEAVANHYPFAINLKGGTGGSMKATVSPGTLNNIIPTNLFTDFPVAATGMVYFWLDVTTDGKKATSMTIATGATLPTTGNEATENTAPADFSVPIGIVKDGKVLQIVQTNLSALPKVAMVIPRTPPSMGEEPYTRWWAWATL
jgi:hypothetical protein